MKDPDENRIEIRIKAPKQPPVAEEIIGLAEYFGKNSQYQSERDAVARALGWETGKVDREIEALMGRGRDLKLDVNFHIVDAPGTLEPQADVTMFDAVELKTVEWLWQDIIPLGKLSMIVGDVGLGKSFLGLALMTHVSRGAPWPVDHAPCKRGDAILISAEDSANDTILPRLMALNADLSHVGYIEIIKDIDLETGERIERYFSIKKDVSVIRNECKKRPECRLVIIDPISAFLGDTDSHNNSEVRGALMPLAKLADELNVAIVFISHINKRERGQNALHRALGSIGFVAVMRAVMLVTPDPQDSERRLFLPMKANLAKLKKGFAYRLVDTDTGTATIQWETETVSISANDALDLQEAAGRGKIDDCIEWLEDMLANGAIEKNELLDKGKKVGHSRRTLERAKDVMNVRSYKKHFQGSSFWELPKDARPVTPPQASLAKSKHLSQSDNDVGVLSDQVGVVSTEDLAPLDESKAGQGKQADRPLRKPKGSGRAGFVRQPSETEAGIVAPLADAPDEEVMKLCRANVKGKQLTAAEMFAEIMKAPEDIPILLSDPECARELAEGLEKRLTLEEKRGERF